MRDGLNDLYVEDRQKRNKEDYDGSGIGNGKYTKDTEFYSNLKSASIFILLDVIASLLFLMVVFMLSKDIYAKNNGTYVDMENVQVSNGQIKVDYEGRPYSFEEGPSVFLDEKAHTVRVYYKGRDYYNGAIMMSVKEYVIAFSVILLALILLSSKIYKTMHVTKHSNGIVGKGKFDD